jgi:Protein of unknown function (DUF402)
VSPARITEVKRRLDGTEERFECEPLLVTEDLAAVSFTNLKAVGGFPRGSTTLGFFWRRRNYDLYRISSPDGELLAHRFDVVDEVRIEPDRVEYLDLLLDVRVSPTGDVEIEDEEEVRRAADAGLLDDRRLEAIERALRTITRDWRRIVREALRSLPDPGG